MVGKSPIQRAAENLFQERLEDIRNCNCGEDTDQEDYKPLETGLNKDDTKALLSALEYVGQANLEHVATLEEAQIVFNAVINIIGQAQEIFFCRCNKARMLKAGKLLNHYTLAGIEREMAEAALHETFADLVTSQGFDILDDDVDDEEDAGTDED